MTINATLDRERLHRNIQTLIRQHNETCNGGKKLTQEEIATKWCSRSSTFISKIKSSESNAAIDIKDIIIIAAKFNVTIDKLLFDDLEKYDLNSLYLEKMISDLIRKNGIWYEFTPEYLLEQKDLDCEHDVEIAFNADDYFSRSENGLIGHDTHLDCEIGEALEYLGIDVNSLFENCRMPDEYYDSEEEYINATTDFCTIDLFSKHERRPYNLIYKVGKNGKEDKIFYESSFKSRKCPVNGNAYVLELDAEHSLYLLKAEDNNEADYYELYLQYEKTLRLDDFWDREPKEKDTYISYREWHPICNSSEHKGNEVVAKALKNLYDSVFSSIHQPVLDDDTKQTLDRLISGYGQLAAVPDYVEPPKEVRKLKGTKTLNIQND